MKYLLTTLLSGLLVTMGHLSYGQKLTNQNLKEFSREFTKEVQALTLEKTPQGEDSEWIQLSKELNKRKNQKKIINDLKSKLPSMQNIPGFQDTSDSQNEAVRNYFENYKNELKDGRFYDKALDEAGQMPYPFCIMNDSCED